MPKKSPYTAAGFNEATTDRTQIESWWKKWPDALVGYATGASGVVVIDIDIDSDKGRDGWHSIEEAGVEIDENALAYQTPRGGTHVLHLQPEGVRLGPTTNHRLKNGITLDGVDLRAGGSYAIYYGDDIPWELHLTPLPDIFATPTNLTTGSAFNGTAQEWIAALPDGDQTSRVMAEMAKIPLDSDFGHTQMLERQASLVHLASEGHTGVRDALELLEQEWTRPPYDTAEYLRDYRVGLVGAIRKFGAFDSVTEPDKDTAVNVIESIKDPYIQELTWGGPEERKDLIKSLLYMDDEDIAAVIWHNPPMRGDLELTALYGLISDIRGGNDELPVHDGVYALITDAELDHVESTWNFVDHYTYVMGINSKWDNSVYHRMMAWNVLSIGFSHKFFINVDPGLNTNLYTLSFGPSGSGKTYAMNRAEAFLEAAEMFDAVDVGSDATGEALQTKLLNRDGMSSWFHVDEGKRLLSKMRPDRAGNVQGTIEGTLTQLYGGRVEMKLRQGDQENSGKRALTYLTVWIGGPASSLIEMMSPEQVSNGFVARFMTAWGEENVLDEETVLTTFMDERETEQGTNRYIRALAAEFKEATDKSPNRRRMLKPTKAAAERMDKARIATWEQLRVHPQFDFFKPAMIRFFEGIWKAAALNACISSLGEAITETDVLVALRSGEEWLTNLVRLMEGIHSSEFSRQVEVAFKFIKANGKVSQAALYRELYARHNISQRDTDNLTDNLRAQDRVKNDNGVWRVTE